MNDNTKIRERFQHKLSQHTTRNRIICQRCTLSSVLFNLYSNYTYKSYGERIANNEFRSQKGQIARNNIFLQTIMEY